LLIPSPSSVPKDLESSYKSSLDQLVVVLVTMQRRACGRMSPGMAAAFGVHEAVLFLVGDVPTPRGVGDDRVMPFYGVDANQPSPGSD
jgi:hypothetical protein